MPFWSRLLDQDLLTELEDREGSRHEQQDQNEDEAEEAAGAQWPRALLVAGRTGKSGELGCGARYHWPFGDTRRVRKE